MELKEGWSLDITSRGKMHYYKDGLSLCSKVKIKFYMKIYSNELGSKWCGQCANCVKKQLLKK